jgi:hypothetical protein
MMPQAFKKRGEKGLWQKTLELMLATPKLPKGEVVAPGVVADGYALPGDKDNAFEWLDKAYAERDGEDITLMKCDPSFKNLRGDPRFGDLKPIRSPDDQVAAEQRSNDGAFVGKFAFEMMGRAYLCES